jgi:hypothetical protein
MSRTDVEVEEKPAAPVKDTAQIIADCQQELSKMLKNLTKTEDLEALQIYFTKKNADLADLKGTDIMTLFLNNYHNAFKAPAMMRTTMVPTLYKELGLNEEDFLEVWNQQIIKLSTMDLPFIKESSGKIMVLMAKEHNINFSGMVLHFDGDEYTREDQSWFYKDMIEAVQKVAEEEGYDDAAFDQLMKDKAEFADKHFMD